MTRLISVVIPAYNGRAFIADAVQSVQAQDFDPIDIVVVDDGSTDDTAQIVRALDAPIRYLRRTRGGPAAARNTGVVAAGGELIAFLDQDDLWPPDHLTTLLQALEHQSAALVAMGKTQALTLVERSSQGLIFAEHGRPWLAPHVGSALFRRAAFAQIGPFDERLEYCSDDLDWFMRSREQGSPPVVVDRVTYLFRIHETNTSRDSVLRREALLEAARASIQRRKASHD